MQDDYDYYYSLSLTFHDISANMVNLVTIFTNAGTIMGSPNLLRVNYGANYIRRKYSVCTAYYDADCYYAVESTDGS